eukprot:TRINITY_DN21720_c0_g1_i1.p1 TRINITY_DN21720_c0_g1~~TRINITY_DN21720_c0_g1_i1.p1  ORF type:complete len:531 (-),score=115.12 TRINITY_DN21720_c0_g1_i1:98-1690(-)
MHMKRIVLFFFATLIATLVVAQNSASTSPTPSSLGTPTATPSALSPSASPFSPSASTSIAASAQGPNPSVTPSTSPLASGPLSPGNETVSPSAAANTVVNSASTTPSAGSIQSATPSSTSVPDDGGISTPSSSPAASPTAAANNPCYCTWAEIPSLDKTENGSYPGSLAYGAALGASLNYLAVGSTLVNQSRGAVDIYTRFANFPYWTYRTTVDANTEVANNNYFGQYLSTLDDANIVVAQLSPAPRLFSFERSGPNSWINVQEPFNLNITRITAFTALGRLLVVSYAGRPAGIDVYNKIGYNWTRIVRIVNPEGGNAQYTQLTIGAGNLFAAITSSGSVQIYNRNNAGEWIPQIISDLGRITAVALSRDRSTLAVGLSNSINLYTAYGNRTFPTTPGATLGSFVTTTVNIRFVTVTQIQLLGSYMVVADTGVAPNSLPQTLCAPSASTGAVYVFSRSGVSTVSETALRPRALEDGFGRSLSYSNTQGNIITVGGIYDTVYTFIRQEDVRLDAISCEPSPSSTPVPQDRR